MSGARITKQQKQAIKSTRKIGKTADYKEGQRIVKAIKANWEPANYN